jgi:hypothetical protein
MTLENQPAIVVKGVEPIDIWRTATLMVKRHGAIATIECAFKADTMLEAGDPDGQAVWLAIRRAAQSLLENGPPTDIPAAPPR